MEDLEGVKLLWKQSHLLEIAYDRGMIDSFRSLCNPFGTPGNIKSWDYEVEVRLAPASSNFSYLHASAIH